MILQQVLKEVLETLAHRDPLVQLERRETLVLAVALVTRAVRDL